MLIRAVPAALCWSHPDSRLARSAAAPLQAEAACPQGALARCVVCNCLFLMEAYALWPLSYFPTRDEPRKYRPLP